MPDAPPLTDPVVLAQSAFAGHAVAPTALAGALVVAAFYFLVGGARSARGSAR